MPQPRLKIFTVPELQELLRQTVINNPFLKLSDLRPTGDEDLKGAGDPRPTDPPSEEDDQKDSYGQQA